MKTKIFFALLLAAMSFGSSAQMVHRHSLGVKMSPSLLSLPQFSYQLGITKLNRFEFNFGMNRISGNSTEPAKMSLQTTHTFQWVFGIRSGWHWFIGPGMQGRYDVAVENTNAGQFGFGVGGQVGLGFDFNVFNVPLTISADHLQMVDVANPLSFPGNRTAVSLRYTIK
jgi:hypothetical protein